MTTAVRLPLLLAMLLTMVGCDRNDGAAPRRPAPGGGRIETQLVEEASAGRASKAMAAAAPMAARVANGTMAYEHSLTVEIASDRLAARLKELSDACKPQGEVPCTVLDVQANASGDVPSAYLRLRLAPSGVETLIALAARDAQVTNRSTHAEDLAEPLADTDRQLTLLTTHRERLLELQKARNLGVDQLITLSRELSSTQAQIESMANQRANLRRRVDTELLSIQLTPPSYAFANDRTPIRDAFRQFGATMRQAVARVIEFIAVLIPWLVILVPGLIGLRLLWRARRRP